MTTSETTETQRDLHADLALCSEVAEHSPHHWFVMHDTDVMSEDPPGSCELDSLAWASAPIVAEFIAEARTGWPIALERAIKAEEIAEMWCSETATQVQQYLDAIEELERLRAGIAVAMTYSGGIIVEMLRKLLTEVLRDGSTQENGE
ncbi:hypothetical protein NSS79_10405 [Paenibacillus sp. FSL L8-0436]|uniref:hypothetical protein n=1 Tax=Paenibacillus sp. FSL L8-0436 TaxID=2954686 RepID=UPI0031582662